MRKLAYIAEVSSVKPIVGADRLEEVMLKGHGWRIVTAKGEFHVGDIGVMHEIDSFINADDPRYAFLRERCLRKFVSKGGNVLREGIRIKTCKLRGVVSQGLLMPISQFPEVMDCIIWNDGKKKDEFDEGETGAGLVDVVGADLTELLNVEHYDEVKEQLQPAMGNPISADAMGPFPSAFIPKTDEERLANLTDWFDTQKGRLWQISEKVDGTSTTCAYSPTIDHENPVIVCSRNLRLKRETSVGTIPVYWRIAEKYGMPTKLKKYFEETGTELALQFETVGPGINGDKDKYPSHEGLVFRIWDITNQKFLNPNESVVFCKDRDIPHVRVIETDFPFFDRIHTYEEALNMADGKTIHGNKREGIVCKTVDGGNYLSFKVVSNKYLLAEGD